MNKNKRGTAAGASEGVGGGCGRAGAAGGGEEQRVTE